MASIQPVLSLLICTVPSRNGPMVSLYQKLDAQVRGRPVEILTLLDNKTRTIGAKRNALLAISRGEYVTYVDDDDDVMESYVDTLLAAIAEGPVDVITFPIRVTLDGSQEGVVRSSAFYENEEYKPGQVTRRKPMYNSCWRRELIQDVRFGDMQYGEDAVFGQAAAPLVKTECIIEGAPIYWYRWSETGTEAR